MELSGMLAVARSVSVSSTREPQCGTTIQNQPSVICRDNGACHPHHRESLNIPLMLSAFQSKQNKHQCLSRQNRGPCLNQMATWFVLSQWKYFGFQRWVPSQQRCPVIAENNWVHQEKVPSWRGWGDEQTLP